MDSQELTGGNAVRQTGKVAMKKKIPASSLKQGLIIKERYRLPDITGGLQVRQEMFRGIGGN